MGCDPPPPFVPLQPPPLCCPPCRLLSPFPSRFHCRTDLEICFSSLIKALFCTGGSLCWIWGGGAAVLSPILGSVWSGGVLHQPPPPPNYVP